MLTALPRLCLLQNQDRRRRRRVCRRTTGRTRLAWMRARTEALAGARAAVFCLCSSLARSLAPMHCNALARSLFLASWGGGETPPAATQSPARTNVQRRSLSRFAGLSTLISVLSCATKVIVRQIALFARGSVARAELVSFAFFCYRKLRGGTCARLSAGYSGDLYSRNW